MDVLERAQQLQQSSWFQRQVAAQKAAEFALGGVTLVETEHSYYDASEGFKAYTVFLMDEEIGTVSQEREHVYKKNGRVRYGDRYLKRWQFRSTHKLGYKTSLYRETRKAALLLGLEAHFLRKGGD